MAFRLQHSAQLAARLPQLHASAPGTHVIRNPVPFQYHQHHGGSLVGSSLSQGNHMIGQRRALIGKWVRLRFKDQLEIGKASRITRFTNYAIPFAAMNGTLYGFVFFAAAFGIDNSTLTELAREAYPIVSDVWKTRLEASEFSAWSGSVMVAEATDLPRWAISGIFSWWYTNRVRREVAKQVEKKKELEQKRQAAREAAAKAAEAAASQV